VTYEDTSGATGLLPAGGIEWMQAGGGVWHGGSAVEPGRTRGFQVWIALPPKLELGPSVSLYQGPEAIQHDGPASVLLGRYRTATSRLKEGERWHYQPPTR
jgi:redox-sensitive bicupin YhaK (pirin superfamily)